MTFFEAIKHNDMEAAYTVLLALDPLSQLFAYKLYKIHLNECCGGDFARYCLSKDENFFQSIIETKNTLNLGGDCGEWHEHIAATFPEYIQLQQEALNVFQTT